MGTRTLPVYVMHVLVISAITPFLPANIVPTLIAVPVLASLAVTACLLVYVPAARVPGIFSLPPFLAPARTPSDGR